MMVGALSGLSSGKWDAWQAGLLGLYRTLLPRSDFRPDDHVGSATLCSQAFLPAPVAVVRVERLRLLGQVLEKGAVSTQRLLEARVGHGRCWLRDVAADVHWGRSLKPDAFSGLPAS